MAPSSRPTNRHRDQQDGDDAERQQAVPQGECRHIEFRDERAFFKETFVAAPLRPGAASAACNPVAAVAPFGIGRQRVGCGKLFWSIL